MDATTAAQLVALNRRFYEGSAESFAATRRRLQPGILRLLAQLPDSPEETWLDLGCGPGALAAAWLQSERASRYLGIDFSEGLLEEARQAVHDAPEGRICFRQADLAEGLPDLTGAGPFEGVLCFATLHHLPSSAIRERIVHQAAGLLTRGGVMAVSVWQFQNAARLLARVQPWSAVGLRDEDVDEGDFLLDWRAEPDRPPALRYVHQFAETELSRLAEAAGMRVAETFYSDGEGGRLGLYSVWEKDP